jgi:hypothetical protein
MIDTLLEQSPFIGLANQFFHLELGGGGYVDVDQEISHAGPV